MSSHLEEGERAFARAVALLEAESDASFGVDIALGLALAFQGRLTGRLYRYEDVKRLLSRSQELLCRRGAQRELALANSLSFFGWARASYLEAAKLLEESLAIYRSLGDRWGIAFALSRFALGTLEQEDETRYLREGLAIGREIGDRST